MNDDQHTDDSHFLLVARRYILVFYRALSLRPVDKVDQYLGLSEITMHLLLHVREFQGCGSRYLQTGVWRKKEWLLLRGEGGWSWDHSWV